MEKRKLQMLENKIKRKLFELRKDEVNDKFRI
jgi:hypothetical protein